MDLNNRRVSLFGIDIHDLSLEEAVAVLSNSFLANNEKCRYVVTPNATQIVQLRKSSRLRKIYRSADLVIADGMPVVWVSRLIRTPLRERVTGADLLPRLCEEAAKREFKVFFLGGNPGVAKDAAKKLKRRFPDLQIVGEYSPVFGFQHSKKEAGKVVSIIKAAQPDIVFVALGFPKQEKWIAEYAQQCGIPLSIGVGAAFDFVAGTLRRAPVWMRRCGLEWLHRLLQEPRRLWHRYLVLGPQFVAIVIEEILGLHPLSDSKKTSAFRKDKR